MEAALSTAAANDGSLRVDIRSTCTIGVADLGRSDRLPVEWASGDGSGGAALSASDCLPIEVASGEGLGAAREEEKRAEAERAMAGRADPGRAEEGDPTRGLAEAALRCSLSATSY